MDGLVACPVCTLYLREGMSLNSHLETHPKDQVIEALVRCVSSERERAITPSIHGHSAIINPFQVVSSEEHHIIFGRQQVTTNILAPLMTYPIYSQQQVLSGHQEFVQQPPSQLQIQQQHPHVDDESDSGKPLNSVSSDDQDERQQQEMSRLSPVPIPLPLVEIHKVDYEDRVAEGPKLEPGLDVSQDVDDHPDDDSSSSSHSYTEGRPTSVIHSISEPTNSSPNIMALSSNVQNDRDPNQEHFVSTHFQDEDARHSEDFIDEASREYVDDDGEADPMLDSMVDQHRRMYLEQQEDDVEACSDSGLQNIQADECMPARGELSGHGSINTAHSWDHDDIGMPAPIWEGQSDTMKRYACLYCEDEFSCPKQRRLHVATVHCTATDTKPDVRSQRSMCVKCGLQLDSLKDLKAHIKAEHKKVTRQCSVCQEEFKSQEEYMDHIVNIHPLECRTCGKTFKSKASLVSHAKIHLVVKPHACTLCPKTFITAQKLKEHMNGHTGYAPIQCNMCDKKFKRYSNLKQHKDSVHFQVKRQAKEFFCECGETFVTKKKLEWHKETHDEKPKQCMYCSERYIHNASLTRHIRKAHNNEYLPTGGAKKKNVVCPICNLTFVDTSLRAHMKQHGTVKQFGCIVCGKKFYTKWNLHLHRWTHASRMSKPYKCHLCKSAFIRQHDLHAHIRSHYNSKPFTCNHCGMQFNRKHNWNRHEKEHLTEKKYVCNECGKTFHRQYYLVEHTRTHTGAKPYSCHICNKTSSTKSNHNKHIRTHHAREAVNTES